MIGTILILYLLHILQTQVRLQNELMNAEKFHLIGEMATSISHEIRNPLTSTKGFLQLYSQIHVLKRNGNYISTSPLMVSNKQIMFLQTT